MAAITADNTAFMESKLLSQDGFYVDYPVAAATTIYKWSFVGLSNTGYLTSYVAPACSTTITGTSLRGIAVEHVDNSAGAAGAKTCRVLSSNAYVTYALSGVAITDVGGPVFCSDNATLSADASTGQYVGQIVHYDRSGYCTFRLDPFGCWAGEMLNVVSPAIVFTTLNNLVMLVHETDNHNGLWLVRASLVTTVAHLCATAAGVVTITHTRGTNTSMGCTITAVTAQPVGDIMVGVGGQLLGAGAADGTVCTKSGDAMVYAPAGVSVEAKVTTASNHGASETGAGKIFATFMSN